MEDEAWMRMNRMLNNIVDGYTDGDKVFHKIIKYEDVKFLSEMIRLTKILKINVLNEVNSHGDTPIMCASKLKRYEHVMKLIDEGADLNVVNHQNQTIYDILSNDNYGLNLIVNYVNK